MIEPSIGRKVWYRAGKTGAGAHMKRFGDQPFDASVVFVHNPRSVNLVVWDHAGVPWRQDKVQLLQDDDKAPNVAERGYAEWMPFQKGQAAKTEALERKAGTNG
jgi:hypothetical protein